MQQLNDIELLRRYAVDQSEEAFATLVSRHVNLVYSAALRQVRDAHLAQDVTQSVFVLLCRKARSIEKGSILSGWLYRATGFVAADALKAESRRRTRENAAMETLFESKGSSSQWDEIEPILDRAMAELGERERDLVLLRYFQNKSFKEIGSTLQMSDDAAQKRVARALEKLREIFARRGVKVTSTGLAAALLTSATQAAPATLIQTVTALTAGSAAAVSVSIFSQLPLMTMNIKTAAAVIVSLGAVSTALVAQRQATVTELRQENAALKAAARPVEETAPESISKVDPVEFERVKKDAEEVHRLRAQVAALTRGGQVGTSPQVSNNRNGNTTAAQRPPIENWMQVGNDLKSDGKLAEALEHYLWCYDEGMKQSARYSGVRTSFLLGEIKSLGEKYPPAKAALVERRDEKEAAVTASETSNVMEILELHGLNEALGQPTKTMALFDQLPATHAARKAIVEYATEEFLRAGRYQDIVSFSNPDASVDSAINTFETWKKHGGENVSAEDSLRRRAVQTGLWAIESLAAVGQVERANAITDKILSFDSSPQTKGEMLKHAQRAGNPSVTAYLQSK